ncbi:CocE/NonD family hydrolase [Mycolicibacterium sp. P9-22]|nr:CocE/NonD family hydrolase [Mycolicibacterium sp. P9-22]
MHGYGEVPVIGVKPVTPSDVAGALRSKAWAARYSAVYDVTVEHDVAAKMRDGTVLRADVYRPTPDGPWPVLLTRLPYGKHLPGPIRMAVDPLGMARAGYIVVLQDTRGRFASDGDWVPGTFDGIVRSNAQPDEFTVQQVDLWSTSHVFRAGHRIRVHVTSSNFPRWARNFNTGEATEDGTRVRTAQQQIAHDAARPSHIILPVIPQGA